MPQARSQRPAAFLFSVRFLAADMYIFVNKPYVLVPLRGAFLRSVHFSQNDQQKRLNI